MCRTILFALAAVWLTGCATVREKSAPDFDLPTGPYKLVVMRPDVAVTVLPLRGEPQRREEESNTARDRIEALLDDFAKARPGETRVVKTPPDAGLDEASLLELEHLHAAVGASIMLFKFSEYTVLPTKRHAFDWTMGELATKYGAASGYDYALFIYARDSFATAARDTAQALTFVGCWFNTLACFLGQGSGEQVAFASLVDLKTGRVVWFNVLRSSVGDIRKPGGPARVMKHLLRPLGG